MILGVVRKPTRILKPTGPILLRVSKSPNRAVIPDIASTTPGKEAMLQYSMSRYFGALVHPEGRSTRHLRILRPTSYLKWCFGIRNLRHRVVGPSGECQLRVRCQLPHCFGTTAQETFQRRPVRARHFGLKGFSSTPKFRASTVSRFLFCRNRSLVWGRYFVLQYLDPEAGSCNESSSFLPSSRVRNEWN